MTRQCLIGELSVRLEQLQASTGQATPDVARLRTEVETGPLTGLASATARAMALADDLCWDSLSRGDAAAFADQAKIGAELCQFGISIRLLGDHGACSTSALAWTVSSCEPTTPSGPTGPARSSPAAHKTWRWSCAGGNYRPGNSGVV